MLDANQALDRVARWPTSPKGLSHGIEEMLIQALNGEEGVIIPRLARRFGVAGCAGRGYDRLIMAVAVVLLSAC